MTEGLEDRPDQLPPYPVVVKVEQFRTLLVPDWRVHWCGDPWTQFGGSDGPHSKVIHMQDMKSETETLQLFLHEVTHALRGVGGHEQEFWDQYEKLVREHLGQELTPMQAKMKVDYLSASERHVLMKSDP